MRRTIAAVAVAASALVPTSALADCAWVLWGELTQQALVPLTAGGPLSPAEHSWTAVMADAAKVNCEKQLAWKVQEASKKDNKRDEVRVGGNMVLKTTYAPEGETAILRATFRFICLPDTVDPRGPKGK